VVNQGQRAGSSTESSTLQRPATRSTSAASVVGSAQNKVLSENMKKLYAEALATTNTKDELKIKLKKNDKATLTKYVNKLEMKGITSDASQEQILDAICEFLITAEGKYRAAFNLSENTYQ